MLTKLKDYLPIEIIKYYRFIISLKNSKNEWKYTFMSNDEFIKIKDRQVRFMIYWKEMLYRTHIVALVSLFKNVRWLESLDNNIANYYGFCSNLRGLIESCADSLFTLRSVPLTIANDFKVIYESLQGKSQIHLLHEKLESILLHYIQATKLTKKQRKQYPKSYNAKQISEYLSCLKDGNEKIIFLYKYLCGISHPAYEATKLFLFLHEKETIVCGDSDDYEIELIIAVLEESKEAILKMYRFFIGNIFEILNLLNYFDLPEIKTNALNEYNIETHISWKEISEKMKASVIRYNHGLQNKEYK